MMLLAIVPALAVALAPGSAVAQSCAAPAASAAAHDGPLRPWPAPLDRVVAPQRPEGAVTLAHVLETLAAASQVRFSFSPELLPLGRLTCLPAGRLSLGDALRTVLAGTGIVPVVAGREQVVLAPERTSANADAAPELARTLGRLERVVVTGTATGGTERASPVALTVIEGAALERAGTRTVAQLLDGAVPGLWMWTQSPTSVTARYGSVRGASSFNQTTPKVYVDGIELANPLLLSQLDASRVQRIEVIRGPQGSALYGTDAISGVINVVTRQDGSSNGPRAELRASAGAASSAYAPQSALAQEHALDLRAGASARTAGVTASVTTLGDFLPGASSRQLSISGGARHVGARLALTGTARYQDARTDSTRNPLVDSASSDLISGSAQRLRQFTLGVNAAVQASDRWTHAFVAGIDGYTQRGVASESLPVLSPRDSLRASAGGHRITLRANTTRRATADSVRTASFTMGFEQTFSRERVEGGPAFVAPNDSAAQSGLNADTVDWRSTGVFAQGQVAWRNAVYLQGGTRLEYISGLSNATQVALLPMVGTAWVRELGPTSLKLRGAFGRGIRPARVGGTGPRMRLSLTQFVDPEEQVGLEWGADLLWDAPAGARVALQATRFDQTASNIVQAVPMANCPSPSGGGGRPGGGCHHGGDAYYYATVSVGEIENDGWEMQASVARGALTLSSSLALVDSRVRKLAVGYSGDLREGDRMLEVPARTLGATATWSARRWTLSTTLARASEWRNYDRIALAAAMVQASADTSFQPPTGAALRGFVLDYPGVTRLGARLDVTLWRATALTLRGDNLLDRQLGEPDNVTVLPGRTVMVGIRTGF
jgi:iron complex outermembrane receptor protein